MSRSTLLPALLGLALVVLPGSLQAQATRSAALRNAADVEAWFGELDQLHGQLEELQSRALDDPQLGAAQADLGARIKLVMERLDPSLQRSLTRMDAMEAEVTAAGQRRDSAKLQQLDVEAEQIQRQFASVHERALQQPEIASLVTAFQQKLERKMVEISPQSERMVARFRELEAKLGAQAQAASR